MASIEAFREEGIVENSAAMGDVPRARSSPKLAERHPSIGDVRGLGLFWGLELVRNRETREPLVPFNAGGEAAAPVARIAKAAMERGLYLFVHWNVVMITPPLNDHPRGARRGPRHPRRRALDRGRVLRGLTLLEELAEDIEVHLPAPPSVEKLELPDCVLIDETGFPYAPAGGVHRIRFDGVERRGARRPQLRAMFRERGRDEFTWWVGHVRDTGRPRGAAARGSARRRSTTIRWSP